MERPFPAGWLFRSRAIDPATFMIALVLWVLSTPPLHAQTLTVLYSFTKAIDGFVPAGGVIRDSAGNLYGATVAGGAFTWGAVYELNSSGQESVLYSLMAGTDGSVPTAGLVRDSVGNLYGTTAFGGGTTACSSGCGTVFKVDSTGDETVLYRFAGAPDGAYPQDLIRDSSGNLYGTTSLGGAGGRGIVYKLDITGQETVLHKFGGGAHDGSTPNSGLVRDSAGNLYGTTVAGGAGNSGTVFKLDLAGNETLLYSFTNGAQPEGGLVRDAAGNLYGTTAYGGVGEGSVFKLDTHSTLTVLHEFTGTDGQEPWGSLIRDSAGDLYGATRYGGQYGLGVVFKVDSAGNETVLYGFSGGNDGKWPTQSSLLRDNAGHLYGTTTLGGLANNGVLYKLTP